MCQTLALRSFCNFGKYDVIYLVFLSSSALSRFTSDKTEADTSSLASLPKFLDSVKKMKLEGICESMA